MHRSLPAQQTSHGRRSGPHVHRASKTKPTPAPGGEGSAARLTEGSGHCAPPSPRLGSPRMPLLHPCAPSSARQPWIRIPGVPHLGCRRRWLSGALQDPLVGVSPPREILCHFPTGHFPSGPPSTGPGLSSHQSPPSAVISVPHPHGSSSITHRPADPRPRVGWARKPSSPGTYTWPQRVRTGWCNTSRHTEQSKDVTGSSGSPRRSRARGVAEAGADFPLSLLSTEPIPAPSAPDGRQKLGACGRLVLLSCGGGRKSRPSCDRRLPARPARTAGEQPRSRRPAWV